MIGSFGADGVPSMMATVTIDTVVPDFLTIPDSF